MKKVLNITQELLNRLNPDAYYLISQITMFINSDKKCFPSNKKLLEQINQFKEKKDKWGIQRLQSAKDELLEKGVLKIKPKKNKNGTFAPNEYKICSKSIGLYMVFEDKDLDNLIENEDDNEPEIAPIPKFVQEQRNNLYKDIETAKDNELIKIDADFKERLWEEAKGFLGTEHAHGLNEYQYQKAFKDFWTYFERNKKVFIFNDARGFFSNWLAKYGRYEKYKNLKPEAQKPKENGVSKQKIMNDFKFENSFITYCRQIGVRVNEAQNILEIFFNNYPDSASFTVDEWKKLLFAFYKQSK